MENSSEPGVYLSITPELERLAKQALTNDSYLISEHDKQTIAVDLERNKMSPNCLTLLNTIYCAPNQVFNACKGSKLIFKQPAADKNKSNIPPSKEFLDHKAKLLRLEEERQYNQMVFGSPHGSDQPDGIKKQFSIITDQAAIGVNMVVATLAAFGIAYYFAAYFNPSPSFCMAIGTAVASGALIMEMVLFIARASNIER